MGRTVYLIRHAKSEANVRQLYGTDMPLSEEGLKQAKDTANILNINPDLVISGTKKRQMQTANILFPEKYKYDTTPVFDEIYFGDLENVAIGDEARDIIDNILLIQTMHNGDNVWERAENALRYILNTEYLQTVKTSVILTSDTLMEAMIIKLVHGKVNDMIWAGKYHIDNCQCIYITVDDDIGAEDANGFNKITGLYIDNVNILPNGAKQ